MSDAPKERELKKRSRHLSIIEAELDAEIKSFVARDSAMQQRATILIGAASITGALQAGTTLGWATIASLVLSFMAAVAGVVVVFPRTGDALNIRTMRDGLLTMPIEQGRYKVTDTKLEILEADDKWLSTRGKIARIGFIALTLSIAIAAVAVLLPDNGGPGMTPGPSPTSVRDE
ncbi:hypothetical protein ITJ44_15585 [Clavibacter sp. VKM Ac-2873]|uniref:hypothetical protein n=1 Tax=Clavibacter sp. VKM Ac-2873 TaxID=2783813 RepID=UPI00188AF992|nr:hypothetical protein [Clavibacter sp. VKM Ac-2873]MBF4619497.1 hypothetical protein [Clavibacter sp. VKM Ac-2873]